MIQLKMFARHVMKNKFYSLNNIMGLAIGIACAIVIMIWVKHETGFESFHQNLDRLYRVCFYTDSNNHENKVFYNTFMPGGLTEIVKDKYPEITHASFFARANMTLAHEDKEAFVNGCLAHPDFMDMFSFTVIQGDAQTALTTPGGMVITEATANRLFAGEEPLGKSITLNGSTPFTVSAVVQNSPHNTHLQFDFMLPIEYAPPVYRSTNIKAGELYIMLDNPNNMQAVDEKILSAYNELNPDAYPNFLFLQPFKNIHLHSLDGKGGRIVYVYIFSLLALFILLMACINYINLSTARASIRAKEIAVKKVIGAVRKQLVWQFLLESLLFSAIAMIIAIIFVKLAMPSISTLLGENLQFMVSQEWVSLLVITLIAGLAAGSYPAFFMSGLVPLSLLKGGSSNKIYASPSAFRKLLVTVQFTLSIFFIICVTIIYTQLNYFQSKPLGFDYENIVAIQLDQAATGKSETIKTELMSSPHIEKISLAQLDMTQWQASASLTWPGKDPDDLFNTGMNRVDVDYQQTFDLEMVDGRFFSQEFPSDLNDACIINEEAVKAMGLTDPVGKQIVWAEGSGMDMAGTIIGVVKNYHTQSLHNAIRPFILFNTKQGSQLYIKTKPGQTRNALNDVESTIKEIVPNYTLTYNFMDDQLFRHYQIETFTRTIILYITVLAIIITLLGLLGLAAFNAERRTKEIGIRKILGASISNIISELSKEFVLLGLFAMLISCPAAFLAMDRWLQNFAFRVGIHWWVFLFAGLSMFGFALVTIALQSLKTATTNPVKTLRYE